MPPKKGARAKRTNSTPVPAPWPSPPPPQVLRKQEKPEDRTNRDEPATARQRSTRSGSRGRQLRSSAGTSAVAVEPQLSNVEEAEEENRELLPEGYYEGEGDTTRPLDDYTSDDADFVDRSQRESTSGTQIEAQSIDMDQLILQLPRLHLNSKQAFNFFSSKKGADLLQSLQKPGSQEGPLLDAIYRSFVETKSYFGHYEFIDLRVIAIVQGVDLFIPMIVLANYAFLGLGLLRLTGLTSACKEYLTNLEMTFLDSFYIVDMPKPEQVAEGMHDMLLEIRTQLFIATVQVEGYESENGDEFLRQVFLEPSPYQGLSQEDEDGDLEAEWMQGCRPKHWQNLTVSQKKTLLERLNDLRASYTTHDSEGIDLGHLTSKWPWDGFVTGMLRMIIWTMKQMNKDKKMTQASRIATSARNAANEIARNSAAQIVPAQEEEVEQEAQAPQPPPGGRRVSARSSGSERLSSTTALRALKKRKSELLGPGTKVIGAATGQKSALNTAPLSYKLPPPPPPAKIATTSAGIKALKIVKRNRTVSSQSDRTSQQSKKGPVAESSRVSKKHRSHSLGAVEESFSLYKQIQSAKNKENQVVRPQEPLDSPPRVPGKYRFQERHPNARKPSPFNEEELLVETQMENPLSSEAAPAPVTRGQKRARIDEPFADGDSDHEFGILEGDDPPNKRSRLIDGPSTAREPVAAPTQRQVQNAAPARNSGIARGTRVRGNSARPVAIPTPPRRRIPNISHRHPASAQPPGRQDNPVEQDNFAEQDNPAEPDGALDDQSVLDAIHGRQLVKERAQKNREVAIPKPNTVNSRRPWSEAEEKELIKLVELVGCKWSKFEKCPKISTRTQVQIKDKARNIKYLYLKARMKLPGNFRFVTLSATFIATLQTMGINHDDDAYYYPMRTDLTAVERKLVEAMGINQN